MGLLGNLFGKEERLPPLDTSSTAAQRLGERMDEVESFVSTVKDKIELVPVDEAVYVFVGKPPAAFGVAWLQDGRMHNFKTLTAEKKLSPGSVQLLSDRLRQVYESHSQEERFSAKIGGRKVTVTPSEDLARDVAKVIHEA